MQNVKQNVKQNVYTLLLPTSQTEQEKLTGWKGLAFGLKTNSLALGFRFDFLSVLQET